MIRIVALGVVFLAGLGTIAVTLGVVWLAPGLDAIAAAAKKSTLPPEILVPIVAGNEADRLPIRISEDTLTNAEKVDIAYVTPTEQGQFTHAESVPHKTASSPSSDITPRQWHDPHDASTKVAREKSKSRSTDRSQKQVSDVTECRSDELAPLLRKLNLSPPCDY